MTVQRRAITSSSKHNGEIVGIAVCKALGLDPKITGRIVIDIPTRGLIQVYAEMYGTAEVVEVITALGGADIHITEGAPEGTQDGTAPEDGSLPEQIRRIVAQEFTKPRRAVSVEEFEAAQERVIRARRGDA